MEIIRKPDKINICLLRKNVNSNDEGMKKENIYMRTLIDRLKERDYKFLQYLTAFEKGWSFSGCCFFSMDGKHLY